VSCAESQLVRALFHTPLDNPPKYLIVIQTAYIDESGTHDDSEWCVVAGFLGNENQWTMLTKEWKKALGNRSGLHMKKLRWNKRQRIARLLSRLGPIPERCGLRRIASVVQKSDYADLVPTNLMNSLLSPYMLAMHPCIRNALEILPREDCINFFFEQELHYAPFTYLPEAAYGKRYRTPSGEPRLSVTQVSKSSTTLTQPADYLAYEINQYLTDRHSDRARMGISILGGSTTMIGARMSRSDVRDIVRLAAKLFRARKKLGQ
jgi:hypothetical protein